MVGHGGTIAPSCWRTKQNITKIHRGTVSDELPDGAREGADAGAQALGGESSRSVGVSPTLANARRKNASFVTLLSLFIGGGRDASAP